MYCVCLNYLVGRQLSTVHFIMLYAKGHGTWAVSSFRLVETSGRFRGLPKVKLILKDLETYFCLCH